MMIGLKCGLKHMTSGGQTIAGNFTWSTAMPSIIMNPRVGISMSDLEVRARKGDPLAQDELERQALAAAGITRKIQKHYGLTREEAQRESKR